MSQASFAKRQREKARKEKAAAKVERRAERQASADEAVPPAPQGDENALLADLADLHARFADGDMDFDDFSAAKEEITRRLQV